MAISLKNLTINADELRAKLQAEQDAKEAKSAPKPTVNDKKFKGELIGQKTNYVLRILPNLFNNEGQGEPWVQTLVHIFPNPQGLKKFALCPKTLDKAAPCPLCEKSRDLYKKVDDKVASQAEESAASRFYKKQRFFANVLVVEDPRAVDKGSQKGKVLVWEMGPQIHEKLKDALLTQKKKFHAVQDGFNFNLVIKKKGEHPNYESSFFDADPSPISKDDSELDRITTEIVDLEKFALGRGPRSYDELKALMEGKEVQKTDREFDSATGKTTTRPALDETVDLDTNAEAPKVAAAVAAAATPKAETKAPAKQLTDDELLAQLDELDSATK